MKPWERDWGAQEAEAPTGAKPWERSWEGAWQPPWTRQWEVAVKFEEAAKHVLQSEGGWVNDPDDAGGETKFGISKRAHPKVDIASLTEQDALNIYRQEYWNAVGAEGLPEHMRLAVFDAAVNQGVPWTKGALSRLSDKSDLNAFLDMRVARYNAIVAQKPKQKKFIRGWLRRVDRLRPQKGPVR